MVSKTVTAERRTSTSFVDTIKKCHVLLQFWHFYTQRNPRPFPAIAHHVTFWSCNLIGREKAVSDLIGPIFISGASAAMRCNIALAVIFLQEFQEWGEPSTIVLVSADHKTDTSAA